MDQSLKKVQAPPTQPERRLRWLQIKASHTSCRGETEEAARSLNSEQVYLAGNLSPCMRMLVLHHLPSFWNLFAINSSGDRSLLFGGRCAKIVFARGGGNKRGMFLIHVVFAFLFLLPTATRNNALFMCVRECVRDPAPSLAEGGRPGAQTLDGASFLNHN